MANIQQYLDTILAEKGKKYIYGAEASPSNPNPRAFDCCCKIGTVVHTDSGKRYIEDLLPGDLVQSYQDGKLVYRPVIAVKDQGPQEVFELRALYATANRKGFSAHVIEATANHPFLVNVSKSSRRELEWKRLDSLQINDQIVSIEDGQFKLVSIASITPMGVASTWDIEIEGTHNFVAEGLVSHNSELVEWGCRRVGVFIPDGAMAQLSWCAQHKTIISIAEAFKTPGALIFRSGSHPHVATSIGGGWDMEAKGHAWPVGVYKSTGRNWTHAARIPGMGYGGATAPVVIPKDAFTTKPRPVLHPGMSGNGVQVLQWEMIYGIGTQLHNETGYGPQTTKAVSDLQKFFKQPITGIADSNLWNVVDFLYALKFHKVVPIP